MSQILKGGYNDFFPSRDCATAIDIVHEIIWDLKTQRTFLNGWFDFKAV